ncbi:hypothetical protein CLF_100903 [Clonorchis sinensis]|uniref:Integrase catalytic domain-containing protein n=1 Tax=Clonorchis sinensis TaxID=79923 RepID=G7Y4I3_CLOSI|nr:hypothetical protein CLF_100903 [Clonorchis sinensis]
MTDCITKWCETVPVKRQDALTIASVIISEWVSLYRVPVILHPERGSAFQSYLKRETCALLEIHTTRTTAYHLKGNGLVELANIKRQ